MFTIVLGGYGVWLLLNIAITILQIGDGGVNAHLALIFTGFPASLLSLLAPHGSLVGVLIAGALGLVQWGLIAKFWGRSRSENGA